MPYGPEAEAGCKVLELDLKCEVCGKPAVGVASSCMGPISHAYCLECLNAHREVWTTLVAGLSGCTATSVADWVAPIIEATCAFYKKTKDELWKEVEEADREYIEHMKFITGAG